MIAPSGCTRAAAGRSGCTPAGRSGCTRTVAHCPMTQLKLHIIARSRHPAEAALWTSHSLTLRYAVVVGVVVVFQLILMLMIGKWM